jgi:hypothetical protein
MIHDRPNLMELVVSCVEVPQRAEISILLGGNGPFVIQVIGDSCCGNEFEVSKTAGVVGIHDRIDDDVYRMQVQSYDGPYLGRNMLGLPILVIDAVLEIRALEERMFVGVRPDEQFAYFEAIK